MNRHAFPGNKQAAAKILTMILVVPYIKPIRQYPCIMLVFFWQGDVGHKMSVKRTDPIMKSQIIEFITEQQIGGRGNPDWINLLPLE